MPAISRRTFIRESAAGAAVLSAGGALYSNPLGLPIGSQTYPMRQRIQNGDFVGVCKDLAGLGVGIIELCSPGYREFASLSDAKQTRKIIEDHGLKCPSAHFTTGELRDHQDQAIAWAKDIGMTQMGKASLGSRPPNMVTTLDAVKRAADEYNKIAENANKAGIQQFLHDEDFEMSRVDGRLVYEVLLERLDPKLVKMQFQMSAMPAVGDPVMYFNKYPGRFISMHLQGVNQSSPAEDAAPQPGAPGAARRRGTSDVAVGKDSVNWSKIFAAAKAGGLKNYFVEQSWDLTVQSVAYLKSLKV